MPKYFSLGIVETLPKIYSVQKNARTRHLYFKLRIFSSKNISYRLCHLRVANSNLLILKTTPYISLFRKFSSV